MARKVYNKLVRDRIPEILAARGKQSATEVLDETAYHAALRAKLVEEAQEAARTGDREALLQELADVMEVVEALCEAHRIHPEALRVAQEIAMGDRGRFTERLLLRWVEEPPSRSVGDGAGTAMGAAEAMALPIHLEREPAAGDIEFLQSQVNAYNLAGTGVPFGGHLACFIRDGEGQIVAGLWGWTWGDCAEIRTLWVHEALRGQGYGSRLLRAAEAEARARDCTQVILDTHSFQAPHFYRRRGYERVGLVEGYPTPHQKLYLRKRL